MPLTEEIIEDACERFRRERDRYEKLTRTVEGICIEHIAEGASLRVNITARTKSSTSFARKLRRFVQKSEKLEWNSVEDVFAGLSDLSGVRIAYYIGDDASGIKEALVDLFCIPDKFDEKNKSGPGFEPHSNYRATHCQVLLKDKDLFGANENLGGLTCEIQICSMMAHVWNEIEHDIGYKPVGVLGKKEKAELCTLADIVRNGDATIHRLLLAHSERVNQEEAIASPIELAEFIASTFAVRRVTFRQNVGRVYDSLHRLGLCGKLRLCKAIGVSEDWNEGQRKKSWADAKRKARRINRLLRDNGYSSEYLLAERNSADPVLAMLLEKKHTWIVKKLPAGRGKGRPPWIRGLASRYGELREDLA